MLAAYPPPMTRSTTSKTTRSSSRIRFAPLPDPRRAVLITENGDEIPLQAWLELPSPLSSLTSSPVKKFQVLDDEFDDDDDKDTAAASIPAAVSLAALSFHNGGSTTSSLRLSNDPPTTAGTMSRSNSEHSLMTMGTPSGSIYSSPSTSTSDTAATTPTPISPSSSTKSSSRTSFFRRFRKSSLASTSSNEDADTGLQRWTSASSGGSLGFPISRTQSAQSDKSHARSRSILNPFSGSTHSLSSQNSRSRKRPSSAQGLGLIGMLHDQKEEKTPTKMLNGRVYGAKRNQQNPNQKNPFANVSTNPDFVEWGYGGMGSVKSSSVGGSVWGKVQSSAGQDDPDDGGGMEWVRKRKEQREKEKLEREKKLQEETVQEEAPAPTTPMDDSPPISTPNVDSGTVTPTTNTSAEHVMSAVKIPAHPHAPKHHHTGSQVSIHTVTEANLYEEMQKKALQEEESKSDEDEEEQKDDEEEQKDDEEEEDEEEEAERMRCMQSIGAGVEKISRHKS